MTARSVKWWSLVHKWTSLICTLFLLMLCITGLPLIFHDEIDELFKSEASARDLPADTPANATSVIFLNFSAIRTQPCQSGH